MHGDNRVVHGLWIGEISRLELLSIHSFVSHGHEFHLWRYEDPDVMLPRNVVVRDANEILPRACIFRKLESDPDSGVGEGSYATFSDLFRVKLLYELGGLWVDLDVVALRPFDFPTPYVFRGHRVGAVMNFIKVPARSSVMRTLLDLAGTPNEESSWLGFTRCFYESIVSSGLEEFVRWDIMPQDSWQTVRPVIEDDLPPDKHWYGIHLLNELWNVLQRTEGFYKGNKIAQKPPNKNYPTPGTTLFKWYTSFGLFHRQWVPVGKPSNLNSPAGQQLTVPRFDLSRRVNAAITSMSLGGAERIVLETLRTLAAKKIQTTLYLLHKTDVQYPVGTNEYLRVVDTSTLERTMRADVIASDSALGRVPTLFIHLMRAADVERLADFGTAVIPVIHNAQPGWFDTPMALNETCAPFLVAVSESVKRQLIEFGCKKPIVALRHEVQRPPIDPEQAAQDRISVRQRHGVASDVLLIGMVGAFKAQKMYTRAVRVLAELNKVIPSRLLILGEWNHEWGGGRAAYSAVCRQALDLGVMADVILPGPIHPIDPYYSAFDVFLNTSLYEGLSVAVLEAIARGCPVVAAPAGGNGEVLTPKDRLLENGNDTGAYVDAILETVANRDRSIPARPLEPDLIPSLWSLLAIHGVASEAAPHAQRSTLVVTENLNIGGPQRSLTNLLTHWPRAERIVLAVLDSRANGPYLEELKRAHIPIVAVGEGNIVDRCEKLLALYRRLRASTLAFWNVPAGLKVLCAKVFEARRDVRIVDVSPGPMLFAELTSIAEFAQRLSFSPEQYLSRLDCFVAKHASGLPNETMVKKALVIRNGVTVPARPAALLGTEIGTACRIAPTKRIEYLIEAMDILSQRMPEARLTVAGAAEPIHNRYLAHIADTVVAAGLANISFVGQVQNTIDFLEPMSVFALISDDQGCPNASLEAMALGLPVVSNDSGGTVEQIDDGVTGFLVDARSPRSMARAIEILLRDAQLRQRMGAAARIKVAKEFSMEQMVRGYLDAFDCSDHNHITTRVRNGQEEPGENSDLLAIGS